MRALADFLFDPLNHLWLVLLLALLLRKKKACRHLFIYAGLWWFLVSVSPLPSWLAAQRESRFPVLRNIPDSLAGRGVVHVLVLGGGHSHTPGLPPNGLLSEEALSRLAEGIRLHRQLPGSKLVCSGYSGGGRTAQAELLTRTAIMLGASPADTLMITTPANTEAEAADYAARFGMDQPLVLVTSALHLPRALFWFRQVGLRPAPAPANFLVRPNPERQAFPFKPSLRKVEMADRLLHEWAGMVYGRWSVGFRSY